MLLLAVGYYVVIATSRILLLLAVGYVPASSRII